MNLAQFLDLARRRWLSILMAAFLGAASAVALTTLQAPQYRASSQLFVSVAGGDNAAELSQANTFSSARVKSYTALVKTPRVLARAAEELHLTTAEASRLASKVSAQATPDTVLITISADDARPAQAAAIANAVTGALVEGIKSVEGEERDGSGVVTVSVFQKAIAPANPYSPRPAVNLTIGLLAGLVVGVAQAVLRRALDTRLRTAEQLRRITSSSILAELPKFEPDEDLLVDSGNRYSTRAEAFRQLRTHLSFTNVDGARSQSIVITSATPGEGKSSTAVNLALVLAQNGSRVVLVDADMRRPTLSTVLGIESRVGLSTVLSRQVELDDAVQRIGAEAPFDVLAAGRVPPNPSELLGSQGMVALLHELHLRYEHVIIDAPPLLPVTDPTVLGQLSSGVLLVASIDGHLRRADFADAVSKLDSVGVRLLGVALNKVPLQRRGKTYYNYVTEAPVSESPRRASRARRGGLTSGTSSATRAEQSS